MWSIPDPRVNMRSNWPVMSFSTCSGGMPEKKVATTTTGILIGGNKSTGIRTTLVKPTTHTARQATTIKCGWRMAKRDIVWDVATRHPGESASRNGGPELFERKVRRAAQGDDGLLSGSDLR